MNAKTGLKRVTREQRDEAEQKRINALDSYFELDSKKSRYVKKLKSSYRWLFYNVFEGESKSLKNAVKAKCLDCCCFDRFEITNCKIETCALYKLRPYQ